jgi:hypothetical protein
MGQAAAEQVAQVQRGGAALSQALLLVTPR